MEITTVQTILCVLMSICILVFIGIFISDLFKTNKKRFCPKCKSGLIRCINKHEDCSNKYDFIWKCSNEDCDYEELDFISYE